MEFRLEPRITKQSAEQRGGGDHGFGAAHETCLRHSDGLRIHDTTGINPGVTRSIAPLAPASDTFYLVSMLCFDTQGLLLRCIDERVMGRVRELANG